MIHMQEFTINHEMDTVLRMIIKGEYTHIFASAYIWNIEIMDILFTNLKNLRPEIKIFLGGPEVSYNPREQLARKSYLDGILYGEGEKIFCDFIDEITSKGDLHAMKTTRGIAFKQNLEISVNAPFPCNHICDCFEFKEGLEIRNFTIRTVGLNSSLPELKGDNVLFSDEVTKASSSNKSPS